MSQTGGPTNRIKIDGTNVTLSSVQVVDNTSSGLSKAVSQSSGTVKGSAGTLYTIWCTTSGSFDLKDGNTVAATISTSAGAVYQFGPWGIPFGTTISVSASAFVGTFVYK